MLTYLVVLVLGALAGAGLTLAFIAMGDVDEQAAPGDDTEYL